MTSYTFEFNFMDTTEPTTTAAYFETRDDARAHAQRILDDNSNLSSCILFPTDDDNDWETLEPSCI